MKKQCINHPKYMYSGKESSPLGLGIAAEPLILGTIQEGRDKTNWIVTQKNGIKVWSRITRLSEMTDNNDTTTETKMTKDEENKEEITTKKKATTTRRKIVKKDDTTQGTSLQDTTNLNIDNNDKVDDDLDDNITLNKKDQATTKRKPTTYNIYMKYKLKQLAKEDSTMKPKERITHAVKLWQSMDDQTKQEIIEKAQEALEKGEI